MEIIVVLVIIAMLAGLIAPRVLKNVDKAKIETTRTQIELLGQALDGFRLDVGRYPTEAEGLVMLVQNPDQLAGWRGPYLTKRRLPQDGWGKDFIYATPATRGGIGYDLYSWGEDGVQNDNDIGNW